MTAIECKPAKRARSEAQPSEGGPPQGRPASRACRGFSLLEVMAATALLGLLYAVLGRVAIQGLGAAGESMRRMEASLLADQVLSDLEIEMSLGTAPPIGEREYEEGAWLVRVRVAAFDPPLAAVTSEGDKGPGPLFSTTAGPAASPLRSVEVEVSWIEGAAERSVSRTTYALDLTGIQALAAQPQEPSS